MLVAFCLDQNSYELSVTSVALLNIGDSCLICWVYLVLLLGM